MSAPAPGGSDGGLHALAERACAAAGTDLATVLADLRGTQPDTLTPAAIRAGWAAPDTPTITVASQEPA